MEKIRLLMLVLSLTVFVQCSKDKNEKQAPDLGKDLMAFFKLDNSFTDSTQAVSNILSSGTFMATKDRKGNANAAMYFDDGRFHFEPGEWQANPITVSLWLKPANLLQTNYLLQTDEGAFAVIENGPYLGFVIKTTTINLAGAQIEAGWTHFAGTYDGKDIKTYINGQLARTSNHSGDPERTTVVMAGSLGNPGWEGAIDDMRFYN